METLRKRFKEFVLSEEDMLDLNILVDEFDFTIPDYVENFYHELFENKVTSPRIKNGYIKLMLEVPIEERVLFFNAHFEMETLKELRLTFSKNYVRQIQELSHPFNIFFVFFGRIVSYDSPHLKDLRNRYKFGWLELYYDTAFFFPLENFKFSYKDMKVL